MDQVALHGCCFPHIGERDAVFGHVGYVVEPFLKRIVLAWRAGYVDAADPAAGEFDGIGLNTSNFQRPIVRAYRLGFRERREEIQRARLARDAQLRVGAG